MIKILINEIRNLKSKRICDNILCFSKQVATAGFKLKDDMFHLEVLIQGNGDENDRIFEIEFEPIFLNRKDFKSKNEYISELEYYQKRNVSVEGWNYSNEELEWREIFFSEIKEILKDLNR